MVISEDVNRGFLCNGFWGSKCLIINTRPRLVMKIGGLKIMRLENK